MILLKGSRGTSSPRCFGGGAGKGGRVVFAFYCSLKLLLWNLNICIEKVDAKC